MRGALCIGPSLKYIGNTSHSAFLSELSHCSFFLSHKKATVFIASHTYWERKRDMNEAFFATSIFVKK